MNSAGADGVGAAHAPSPEDAGASLTTHDARPQDRKTRSSLSTIYSSVIAGLAPYQRIDYARTVVVLGFLAGLLLSSKLWVNSRLFPLIPVLHGLPRLRFPLDYLCAAGLFLLLSAIGLARRPRPYILGFAALLLFLGLYDQNRWQPWAYLYLFLLLTLACFSWKADDVEGQQNVLNICRLCIAATYFYSGLQKFNPHFAEVGLTSLLGPMAARLPLAHVWPMIMAGFEAGIGIGLLTRRFRNLAIVCAIGMHLFILFSCIVIIHWNSVVWPWNVTMIALLLVLFWKADFPFQQVLWRNPIAFQKVALLLFGILPVLSFFGLWDSYLSASLYSANVPQANVLFRGAVEGQIPTAVQRYVKRLPGATDVLNIRDWSMGELNVPPYPAMRVYRTIGNEVCKYAQSSPDVVLVMLDRDTLLQKASPTQDTCLGTLMVNKW
ncbi:MAG TPA: hypothetical protein VFB04_01210 [Terriglobales bacterium]|nr:hypothetical protein [Terriglobales bacterium]